MTSNTDRNPIRASSPRSPRVSHPSRRMPTPPSRWQWDADRFIGVASAATLVFAWVLL